MSDEPTPPGEWVVPAGWRTIEFISDLHLAEDTPRTFAAWADYLRRTPADAVLILGDLFESWVGDDARFDAFESRGVAVLRDAAERRTLAFMAGNRDFLLGPAMLEGCGIRALADPTVISAFGRRVFLTHGDAMCIDDVDYQRFRAMVRQADWQREFLARPLDERREIARAMRARSEAVKAVVGPAFDVDKPTALARLRESRADILVHGHTHRPATEALATGIERLVLSDWDCDHARPRAEVLRWSAAGFERLSPDEAVRPAA